MHTERIRGKTIVITGASSGIGAEIARLCASKGANLVLLARSIDKLNDLKIEFEAKYSAMVDVYQLDVSNTDAVCEVFRDILSKHGYVDVLVNNAGFGVLAQVQRAQRQGARPAMLLLTGGGAELNGLDAFLSGALRIPVVAARPAGLTGAPPPLTRPAFAVATGLLLLGARQRVREMRRPVTRSAPFIGRVRRRLFASRGHRDDHGPRR